MVFGKSGKELNLPIILLVAIVLLMIPGVPDKISSFLGLSAPAGGGSGTGSNTNSNGACIDPTVKVTMTLDSEEMYSPTTTPGGDNAVWLNGKYVGTVPNAGTLTVSPGDQYKILWVSNSSTHYGKVTEGVVPCSGTLRLHEKLYKMDLGSASTTWANVYNEKGQDNSVTTNNITLNAGDVKSVKVEVKGTYKKSIGNVNIGANSNILACKYNTTALQSVAIGSYPQATPTILDTGAAGYSWTAVQFPVLDSNKLETFLVTLTANPNSYPTGNANTIFCQLDDADYTIHHVTNDVISGQVDDVNTDLGMSGAIWNFSLRTA